VYDLSSLRFQVDNEARTLSALSATGELLATVDVPDSTSEREAIFLVLDSALDSAKVIRDDGAFAIAFANPYTNQVACGAIPDTVAYGDNEILELPPSGVPASICNGVLQLMNRELLPIDAGMASVSSALSAHRN